MNECLDEQMILAFGRGQLDREKRRPIEKHLATCDECRSLVSAVARSSFVDPKELMDSPPSSKRRAPAPAVAHARDDAKVMEALRDAPSVPRLPASGDAATLAAPDSSPRSPVKPARGGGGGGFDKRVAVVLVALIALLLAAGAYINAAR